MEQKARAETRGVHARRRTGYESKSYLHSTMGQTINSLTLSHFYYDMEREYEE